jgi:4-diphosphocytidyl-2-C-methyl-D-erythritol kinase
LKLRVLAPGKVNLCLFLGGPRPDGRHELVTLLESVSLADELELSLLAEGDDTDEVVCPGISGENLVARALQGLRARGWDGPPVRIEIRKHVPVAAGMGGGSADAAATLRLARQLGRINHRSFAELAAELGADVPSQLAPGLVLGTGAGDSVQAAGPLAPHALVIIPLALELATAEVYREADRLGLPRGEDDLRSRHEELLGALGPGVRLPERLLVNDLQPAAVSLCPAIADALAALRDAGAATALVCGSGPTTAGLYWGPDAADRAAAAAAALGVRFAGATSVVAVSADFGLPLFA